MEMPPEECGVFGIYGHDEAAVHTYLGLYALQHRGQESAGIISTTDGKKFCIHKKQGLVSEVFNKDVLAELPGISAIGHVRYSTTGSSKSNAQPLFANYKNGSLAIAHNGNIINAYELKQELEKKGAIFQTTMDSEILIHLIAQSEEKDIEKALINSLKRLEGSYSFLLFINDMMIAVRDPRGIRPLCLGKIDKAYTVSSESCAFDIINAKLIREVEPGEIIFFSKDGMKSIKPFEKVEKATCVFEYIYYTRPDSVLDGKSVYEVRRKLGAQLAKEHPVEADIVIPVPDSSNIAASGYAEESGIPFGHGIIRNHYIGRTFIEPHQHIRDFGAKIKYNPVKSVFNGKRLIVVDDSIVRGTTCAKIVKMLRKAGAKEVHFRISSPPIICPCFYGIDTPDKKGLIAANNTIKGIAEKIDADTIGYLSLEGLKQVMDDMNDHCYACFNGTYPCGQPKHLFKKEILEGKC